MRSVAELAAHARELASAFKIRYVELAIPLDEAVSAPAFFSRSIHSYNAMLLKRGFAGEVRVPPIVTEFHYAVVLHEQGHCAAPGGIITPDKSLKRIQSMKLHEEQVAWEWAQHYALEWTTEMEAAKKFGLESYFADAREQLRTQVLRKTETIDEFLRRRK